MPRCGTRQYIIYNVFKTLVFLFILELRFMAGGPGEADHVGSTGRENWRVVDAEWRETSIVQHVSAGEGRSSGPMVLHHVY